jgi:tetratricopeptide (TPR) repeat protein
MADTEGKSPGKAPPRKAGQTGAIQEGIRLYRLKRWDLALQELLLVNTEKFTPEENAELAYYLGLCYTKLERFDDALLYLEQVVTSSQDPLRVYQCRMTLAYIYVLTKRSKMAEFELHRLANNGFESAQLYATLAFAAWTQKHYQQAVDYYEKALDLDETNTTALNGLGFVLVDANIDPLRGLRCCRKAVDLKPQSAAYLDSLGWAYFKNGELLEARTWLRRAIEAAPQQKEIKDHLRVVTGEV